MSEGDFLKNNTLIGEILIKEGIITPQQLEIGLSEQKKTGEYICTTLIKLGFVSEEKILPILSRQLNIPYIRIKEKEIPNFIIRMVPAKFANHYKIIPIDFKENCLVLAMSNPLNAHILDNIRLLLGFDVKPVLTSETEINEAIRKYYGLGADTLERIIEERPFYDELRIESGSLGDLENLAEDASIIKFVNQILLEAVKERATDIHIEPFEEELCIRFRIDGILYKINIPETVKYFHSAIVSRIKIMAQMNIAEHRLPQDGRTNIIINGDKLDLRISSLPTAFGEAIHLRILSSKRFLELEKLGLLEDDLKIIENIIKKPHGIIFVTGPTGSGKSTTLYAILSRINSEGIKIITIEDPIEYEIKGINQMQVLPKIGFDFAVGLRHILRHDPDVIMVGEVRDKETAEIAIRSALTGHLVFSTLHTNDSAGAITRLVDMGIEKFLVASSLECIIAQRLVRLICPDCKMPIELKRKKDIFSSISNKISNFSNLEEIELYEGKGCKKCRFTGYFGRTGIYEIMLVEEEIRDAILKGASSQQIKQLAISKGMRSLWEDGLRKVFLGLTTLTEVMRVTQQ